MLELYFLGKTKMLQDGADIATHFRGKTVALLCLLVLNQNQSLSREKITAYLWPDSSEEAAKYNLRYNLWLIKKHIKSGPEEEPFLIVDKNHCGLNPSYPLCCDVLEILGGSWKHSPSVAELRGLRELAARDFLEGYYFNGCNELNELIISKRTQFVSQRVDILMRLAQLYEVTAQYEECIEVLREVMDIELYDETVALKILEIYEKSGKRSAAILFYQSMQERLARQLGIRPSKELSDKFAELKKEPLTAVGVPAANGQSGLSGHSGASELGSISANAGVSAHGEAATDVDRLTGEERYGSFAADDQSVVGKPTLTIRTCGIAGVKYFWLADLVKKLFAQLGPDLAGRLNDQQLSYLRCIVPDLLTSAAEPERADSALPVQIVNSVLALVEIVCQDYQLQIQIYAAEDLDEVSAGVVKYLQAGYRGILEIIWG